MKKTIFIVLATLCNLSFISSQELMNVYKPDLSIESLDIGSINSMRFNAAKTALSIYRTPLNRNISLTEIDSITFSDEAPRGLYSNPVVTRSLPDPTALRAEDGYYYLYATKDTYNMPIMRSGNLVDWTFVGIVFTNATRPDFEPGGGLWAPDINYINGKYVIYYSMSVWGGESTCGISVAVADQPRDLSVTQKCFSAALEKAALVCKIPLIPAI